MKPSAIYSISILALLLSCQSKTEAPKKAKRFKEAENTAVFTTQFVVKDKHDITKVIHEQDDNSWQFLSDDEYESFEDVAMVVTLKQMIKIDSSLLELADMKVNCKAQRNSKKDKWVITCR